MCVFLANIKIFLEKKKIIAYFLQTAPRKEMFFFTPIGKIYEKKNVVSDTFY